MLQVRDIHKSFGNVHAVRGASFEARDGEVTGLIGPNGAGKTTILRTLYTVLNPDSGTAVVDGFDSVKEHREVQRRIGALPDVRGLYPRLTGREHLKYFGRLHRVNGKELDRRIDGLVEALSMEDFADRRAKGFSRGQTLKVTLARAMVHQPQNLILDEPTNGLDVATIRSVRALLKGLTKKGRCIVLSSHVAVADRVVIMAEGRVVLDGPPEDLCREMGSADLEGVFLKAVGRPLDEEG